MRKLTVLLLCLTACGPSVKKVYFAGSTTIVQPAPAPIYTPPVIQSYPVINLNNNVTVQVTETEKTGNGKCGKKGHGED
jgi:hypothetical protein